MVAIKQNVSIKLKPQTISKIKKISEQRDQRPSELMREVLENYVNMH